MKQTELNQEQFLAVEGWIKNFPITSDGSSMLSQFNKYFAPKQIPNEAVCKEAKHNEREMAVKEAFKQIMNDIKSPQMAFLSFNIDDFFERERPKAESEIKIGDRVKLKGDSNSPEMIVVGNSTSFDVLDCAYFIKRDEGVNEAFVNATYRLLAIHKDALQKLIPVQPSNKK
jgi:hypothetical protein